MKQLLKLHDFMCRENVSVSDLKKMCEIVTFYGVVPLIENGEELSVALRYSDDKSVSKTFQLMRPIQALHLDGFDLSIKDAPIPLPYSAAEQFCAKNNESLPTSTQMMLIFSQKDKINNIFARLGMEPIKDYLYWLSDKASKPCMAKVFDMRTGKVKEEHKKESFRTRPVYCSKI